MKSIYQKTVLPDGLRIISETIPTVRSITIGLWIDAGSRDETAQMNGISHFIEHMVFKGTTNRSAKQIATYLESVGGILNAFTSREQTCFYAKIIDERLPQAVEILADLAFNSLFDSSEIEKEKNVIIDEINEVYDTPADLVHDLFANSLFGDHSLGRPILGSSSTVLNLSRGKIIDHIKKYYQKSNMLIAASGNLEHKKLVDLVNKYFAEDRKDKSMKLKRIKPQLFPGLNVTFKETNQTHICIGSPALKYEHPERPTLLLLNSIIGGGMSSKLYQRIREELGLAYTIFSYLDFFIDASVIGVYLNTDKKHVVTAILAVLKELTKLKDNELDSKEIETAKEQLKGSLILGLENTSNRMNRMAKHEFLLGRYISVGEAISEINKITAYDIKNLAEIVFQADKFTITVLGPVSERTVEKAINL